MEKANIKERKYMKIIVCIKQVPDTKGGVKFNPDGTLDRAAMLAIMNPDDNGGMEAPRGEECFSHL